MSYTTKVESREISVYPLTGPLAPGDIHSSFFPDLYRWVLTVEMRKSCYRHHSQSYFGRSIIAAVTILFSFNFFAVSQSSPLTDERELLSIYREIKRCESESLRVIVTIDALEEELHEHPNTENREQLHVQLGRLYKYDVLLSAHYIDLNKVWSYLQDPERESAPTSFDADQSKPIPKIHENIYEGLADDTIPATDFSPINIKDI